ncbi:MAG: chitobiase/beta-hexosaminidase C-terminal domain-containing protein [Opitutaceae bacterium]
MIARLAQSFRNLFRPVSRAFAFPPLNGKAAKAIAAVALAGSLSGSAQAQVGSGWVPTTESYVIQISAGCTAVPLPGGGTGGVFNVPGPGIFRSEFRFQDLSETVTEQFQGDVTLNSLAGNRVTVKQTFGPEPSSSWSLIAVDKTLVGKGALSGYTGGFYDVHGSPQVLLAPFTAGQTARINTIYNPLGGAGHETVDVYINGTWVEQLATGTGPNYNKIGSYVSSTGTGPCMTTWQNVLFWIGGGANGNTPVTVDTPDFNPAAGTYANAQTVILSSTTSGASISYTTDGSTPSATHGVVLANGGSATVSANTTLKAMAFASGETDSPVATAPYAIQTAGPTFSPVAGTYTSPQTVAISSSAGGASIAYTMDGSLPTESNGLVTHGTWLSNGGSVAIGGNVTLNAIAFANGLADSPAASAVYVINVPGVVSAPTFSPAGGTYASAQTVTISSSTGGVSIRYTTDGSMPSETAGMVYAGAIAVSANTTIKAVAYASGLADSTVSTAAYTVQAALPTFSPAVTGTYTTPQSVTISSATSGASIAYTTDTSLPTESGCLVTHGTKLSNGGSVSISANTVFTAIAFKSGLADSPAASGPYTVTLAVAPTFTPAAGTYASAQSVAISSVTAGASIRYTTNGSAPTETTGIIYSGAPVPITSTTTLKAIAYRSSYTDSPVASGAYTLVPPAVVPTFGLPTGTYTGAQSVSINSTTSGASIAYTTDGSTPAESGGAVTNGELLSNGGSVLISTSATLEAIAFESGFADSSAAAAIYTIDAPVPTALRIDGSDGVQSQVRPNNADIRPSGR